MKSVLEKGSCVAKAIEKAWKKAGEPEEFMIKVFETEKKGFWGLLKKPAVVSMIYEPVRGTFAAGRGTGKVPTTSSRIGEIISSGRRISIEGEGISKPYTGGEEKQAPFRREREKPSAARPMRGEQPTWDPGMLMDISRWLKDMVDAMNVQSNFSLASDRVVLKISFAKPVISELEYERMLFAGFAHLLMQFLKKKYKNKFRALRLSLTSLR